MTFALVPAAGHSRRMGRPKLALPLGSTTVLCHVLDALRVGGISETLVVLAPHVSALEAPAREAGAHVLLLPEATAGMRATIEHGLAWLEARFHPAPDDDWLLTPADHPALNPATITTLRQARLRHPHFSIVVPTWQGQRGHPALIAWKHVRGIRAHPSHEGLNSYLRQYPGETLECESSPAAVEDLDTPQDYERLLRDRSPSNETTKPDPGTGSGFV